MAIIDYQCNNVKHEEIILKDKKRKKLSTL